MVRFRRTTEITVAAVLFASLGGAVFAQSAADAIAARQAFMKSTGAATGAIRTAVTGGDMAAAKAAAQKLAAGFHAYPGQFPVGSDASAGKTRAKAEIWSDAAGFKAATDKAAAAADALLAATNGTDAAAVTAALTALQGNCGSCHTAYRGPAVT